jgi:glycosyltransferase involved in cell wall biosynthesis
MKTLTVSLVISTYNRPDALEACLESVRRQSVLPIEVIIADDGSTEETRQTIERLAGGFPVPILHVWQEDDGFRLAKIRNRAMACAKGEYIVQTDGDIVMANDFIADHIRLARRNSYAKGVRVRLEKEISDAICRQPRRKCPTLFSKGLMNRHKALRFIPLAHWFACHFKKGKAYGLGCNMAFFKTDLLKVNGYDEAFEGWGREDDDIAHRLYRAGVAMRDIRFAAVCFHLWHKENSRDDMEENMRRCRERDETGVIRAERGIDQYL